METAKVTNEQVRNFRLNAQIYIDSKPGVFSKFIYALNKGMKNTKDADENYTEKHADLRYDLALKDEKTKAIIVDKEANDFAFSDAGRKEFDKKHRALLKDTVDVCLYDLDKSHIPTDLTVSLLEVLSPFVVSEATIEKFFEEYKPADK